MITIILVDDHRLVRAGLRRVVSEQPDMEVLAEAASGEEAIDLVRAQEPDVMLLDVNMPGLGGLEATRRIHQRFADVKIIGVSMHIDEPYPSRLLAAGAVGYIGKDSAADEVVTAIRRVHAGGHYVASAVAGNLAAHLSRGSNASPFDALSQRELQVMYMLTQGLGTQAISDRLCLSPKTVSTYRYRLFEKLGVHNDVELTRLAMRYDMLDDQQGQTNAP